MKHILLLLNLFFISIIYSQQNENLENSNMSKNIDENNDENNFVCEHNDKDCWHRYSSAMGDCV